MIELSEIFVVGLVCTVARLIYEKYKRMRAQQYWEMLQKLESNKK